eukprot:s2022_g3.t1
MLGETAKRMDASLAGLPSKASFLLPWKVWVGNSSDVAHYVLERFGERSVAMIFMDHRGSLFHDDLKSFEEMKLLQHGCRVLADNTLKLSIHSHLCLLLKPGAPLFLWHVSSSPAFATELVMVPEFGLGHQVLQDWVAVSSYDLGAEGSSTEPPPVAVAELSECCDALRRRSLAGGLTSQDGRRLGEACGGDGVWAESTGHRSHGGERANASTGESRAHELYLEKVVREASKFHARRSRGSIGHPEVCRRPCVFLAAGRCGQGGNCGYCHCEHNEPRARPDKKQRAALQGLQQDDLFAVVLPHLQVRAELPQLRGKATQLLRIVEDISITTSPCASPSASSSCTSSSTLSDSKLKSLNKTLERMTFAGLVALLCESIAKGNTRDELLQALDDMRAQCDIPPCSWPAA